MKELDDIAHFAAIAIKGDPSESAIARDEATIRSAIDKAIEFVLTREPSANCIIAFQEALDGRRAWVNQVEDGLRAMQAALLEELKHETRR